MSTAVGQNHHSMTLETGAPHGRCDAADTAASLPGLAEVTPSPCGRVAIRASSALLVARRRPCAQAAAISAPRAKAAIPPLALALLFALWPCAAHAYIGPGAGFAVVGSLGVVLATFVLALFALATYPFRATLRFFRARRLRKPTDVKGVVILGLDGLDPDLTQMFMDRDMLPNLKRLAAEGCFHKLRTTCPAMSPVAWSTFATGVDPSRHNIFDFLNRDRATYIPVLSSTEITAPTRKLKLGRYVIPLGKPSVRLLRKSRPFWNVLGDCYVSCHVIRVPLTFPPEKCSNGLVLSAMCVPDLRGTQGSFTYFTTRPEEEQPTGGRVESVSIEGEAVRGEIPGPPDPMRPDAGELTIPFAVRLSPNNGGTGPRGTRDIKARSDTTAGRPQADPWAVSAGRADRGDDAAGQGGGVNGGPEADRGGDADGARPAKTDHTVALLEVDGEKIPLRLRSYTPWVRLTFSAGLGVKVRGICRFLLLETGDHFGLYMTPINIDPEKPAMPISKPGVFATYLAKLIGSYATLGLAEDTWALNEKVLDEEAFLDQAYIYHNERERMFFNSLTKNKRGMTVCVFDASDRIQHMFLRHFDGEEPAGEEGRGPGDASADGRNIGEPEAQAIARTEDRLARIHRRAIEEVYVHMDQLVGRTMEAVDSNMVLMVISDHGFKVFKRGVNLNSWFIKNGYMVAEGGEVGEYFKNVDWSKTKAYAFGLSGIYINKKGRERKGIVDKSEFTALKRELREKLEGLVDEETGEVAIRSAYDTAELYSGPYVDNGPDLIIGYNEGYRASWDGAVGKGSGKTFEDNAKNWGGDHCMDPEIVPGVFFSNRKINASDPSLMDISTSTLSLFGVQIPHYMKGRALFPTDGSR